MKRARPTSVCLPPQGRKFVSQLLYTVVPKHRQYIQNDPISRLPRPWKQQKHDFCKEKPFPAPEEIHLKTPTKAKRYLDPEQPHLNTFSKAKHYRAPEHLLYYVLFRLGQE